MSLWVPIHPFHTRLLWSKGSAQEQLRKAAVIWDGTSSHSVQEDLQLEYSWAICSHFTDGPLLLSFRDHPRFASHWGEPIGHLFTWLSFSSALSNFQSSPWPCHTLARIPFQSYIGGLGADTHLYFLLGLLGEPSVLRRQSAVLRDSVVTLWRTEEAKTGGRGCCAWKCTVHIISLRTWEMTSCSVRTVWAVVSQLYLRLRAYPLHAGTPL